MELKNYGCKARIMHGPNKGTLCGEDCILIVDKKQESQRFKHPESGHIDIFLFPSERGEYCQYHQRLKDGKFSPYFPDSQKGV
jgi:hypothetical protein